MRAKAIGIDVIIRGHLHEVNRPALPGGGSLFLEGGKGISQVALRFESVIAVDAIDHAVHVDLPALGTRRLWNQRELIDGPQLLLGSLMRLESLSQSRWPRKQTNSPVGDIHILVGLVGLLVDGVSGVFKQIGVQRQFRSMQLPPHVAPSTLSGDLNLKGGRGHQVRRSVLDNVLCCSSGPFKEALVVVRVEPAINQVAMWACADGFLVSLIENGKNVAVLLESVYRLLDPFAEGFVRTVEPKRLSRASMVSRNEMTI